VTASRISIARVLGLEGAARAQNPSVFQTGGGKSRWYIRPFIDSFDAAGNPCRVQQRIYLGTCAEMGKREALAKKSEVMARVNHSHEVLQTQLRFGALLDHYLEEFVRRPDKLSASTRAKYEGHIAKHVRPAFGHMQLGEIRGLEIDRWLGQLAKPGEPAKPTVTQSRSASGERQAKIKPGLSWHTRTDLRNIVSGIFTKAAEWGLWKGDNPAATVSAGRRREARKKRKLTIEETRQILDALPEDVRLICEAALFCTLRISEVLGLAWAHIDFVRGMILVRQRFYRGDLDAVKSASAERDVPMGDLARKLADRYPGAGHESNFVFSVETHKERRRASVCRSDRDINQHFLRPAAKALGIYYLGFGFHAFRREAVTEHAVSVGGLQAQRMAGHARADMSLSYTLADHEAQDRAVRALQARVRGEVIELKRGA
jgi:integrase